MENPTRAKECHFRFAIDYLAKKLRFAVAGDDGAIANGAINSDQISRLAAHLSQMQYALDLSEITGEEHSPPFDPLRPFQGGQLFGKFFNVSQSRIGVDDMQGKVAALLLDSSGRLTGYRMSPEKAREVGRALLVAADQIQGASKPKAN